MDIALASDAEGLHIGEDDMLPDIVRRFLPDKIIGYSANEIELAMKYRDFVDYFGVGAVFPSETKKKPTISLAILKEIKEYTQKPVVAIGGITIDNVKEVLKYRVDGVAVAKGLLDTDDIESRAREFRKIIDNCLK